MHLKKIGLDVSDVAGCSSIHFQKYPLFFGTDYLTITEIASDLGVTINSSDIFNTVTTCHWLDYYLGWPIFLYKQGFFYLAVVISFSGRDNSNSDPILYRVRWL